MKVLRFKFLLTIIMVIAFVSFVSADWVRVANYTTGAITNNIYICNDTSFCGLNFSSLLGLPTTIAGYGITDAYTMAQIDAQQLSQNNTFWTEISNHVNNATLNSYLLISDFDASQLVQNNTIDSKIDSVYGNLTYYPLASNPSGYINSSGANFSGYYNGSYINSTYLLISNYQSHNQNLNTTSNVTFVLLNATSGIFTGVWNMSGGADALVGSGNVRLGTDISNFAGRIGFEYKNGVTNTLWQIDNGGDSLRFFNDFAVYARINTSGIYTSQNIGADNTIYEGGLSLNAKYNDSARIDSLNSTKIDSAYGNATYLLISNFTSSSYINWSNVNNSPTNLSYFVDDLGNRGYSVLSNFSNDKNFVNGSGASNRLAVWSSNVTLGNSSIYVSSDRRVGIFDDTPDATLDVNVENASVMGLIVQGIVNQNVSLFDVRSNVPVIYIEVKANGTFYYNNSEVCTAGNGICVTNTSSLSSAISGLQANVSAINQSLTNEINARATAEGVINNTINTKMNISDQRYNETGRIDVLNASYLLTNATVTTHTSQISGIQSNITAVNNSLSGYLLNTGDTASGNYSFDSGTLFVDSSTNRVGIGTTSPSNKLTVNTVTTYTSEDTYAGSFGDSASNKFVNVGYSSASDVGLIQSVYRANAWNRLSINPNGGWVGINKLVPVTQLDVTGGFRLNYDADKYTSLSTRSDGNFQIFSYNGSAYKDILLGVDGATTAGNVGIGTTSPTAGLTVSNGRLQITTSSPVPTGGTGLELSHDGTTGKITSYDRTNSLNKAIQLYGLNNQFYTNGSERMRIDDSGKVGIGTTSPGQKFQVNADIADWVSLLNNANAGGYGLLLDADVEILRLRSAAGGNRHRFLTNGDVYLDLVGGTDPTLSIISHNVGIGTLAPNQKLNVEGNTNITGELWVNGINVSNNISLNTAGIWLLNGTIIIHTGQIDFLNASLINETSARQSLGNWSNDKQYYYNKTESDGSNLAQNNSIALKFNIADYQSHNQNLNTTSNVVFANIYNKTESDNSNTVQNNTINTKLSINGSGNLGNITFNGGFGANGVSITGGNYWGDGNLYLTGNITASTINNLNFNASNLPSLNNTWNIGSTALYWANGYFTNLYEGGVLLNTKYALITSLNDNVTALNTAISGRLLNSSLVTHDQNLNTTSNVVFANIYNKTEIDASQLAQNNSFNSLISGRVLNATLGSYALVSSLNGNYSDLQIQISGRVLNATLGSYALTTAVDNATILRTFTSLIGDVTGHYDDIVITDDSHLHTKSTITIDALNITSGTINDARLSSATIITGIQTNITTQTGRIDSLNSTKSNLASPTFTGIVTTSNITVNGNITMNTAGNKWKIGTYESNGNFTGQCYNGTALWIGTSFNISTAGC